MACLKAFEGMGFSPDSSFTSLALQQVLAVTGGAHSALADLMFIQSIGQQPQAQDLLALEQKVRARVQPDMLWRQLNCLDRITASPRGVHLEVTARFDKVTGMR